MVEVTLKSLLDTFLRLDIGFVLVDNGKEVSGRFGANVMRPTSSSTMAYLDRVVESIEVYPHAIPRIRLKPEHPLKHLIDCPEISESFRQNLIEHEGLIRNILNETKSF